MLRVVLSNAVGYFQRKLEGGSAFASADFWLCSRFCTLEKIGQFPLQRLALLNGDGFADDFATAKFAD